MKTKTLLLYLFMFMWLTSFSQPTYLAIQEVIVSPSPASTSDQINVSFSGYFSSTGISVQNIVIAQTGNLFDFQFNLIQGGMGLPVLIDFDTIIGIGNLPYGQYQISISGFGVSNFADSTGLSFLVTDSLSTNCEAMFINGPDSGIWIPEVIPVAFTDVSVTSSPIVSWLWDFGDGTTSTLQNPSHGYDFMGPGTYQVCLTITTLDGCIDSICQTVFVNGTPCLASFSGINITGNPFGYQFYDSSTGPPVSWFWDFGNGVTSTLQEPFFMFPGIGVYTVCLTITTPGGCISQDCQTFQVGGGDPCQGVVIQSNAIVSNASSATLCDGSIVLQPSGGYPPYSYLWWNGSIAESVFQLCTGDYAVTLSDSLGCYIVDNLHVGININPCDSVDVIQSFLVINASGQFTNDGELHLILNGEAPYSLSWANQIEHDTSGLFPGEYHLTVSDSNGCSDSIVFNVSYPENFSNLNSNNSVSFFYTSPNELFVVFDGKKQCSVHWRIFDIAGRTVISNEFAELLDGNLKVKIPEYIYGVFVIEVLTDEGRLRHLIIKP